MGPLNGQRARRAKQAGTDPEREELEQQAANLEEEIRVHQMEREFEEKRRQVELQYKEAEGDPDVMRQRLEDEARQRLLEVTTALEAQLQELDFELRRMDVERSGTRNP